jgi:hypothetical protein
LVLGDLNELLKKKKMVRPFLLTWANASRTCLNTCGLMDLGFSEPKFTWANNRQDWNKHIKKRLDRLENPLPKYIFFFFFFGVNLYPNTNPDQEYKAKSFKFETMWPADHTFQN